MKLKNLTPNRLGKGTRCSPDFFTVFAVADFLICYRQTKNKYPTPPALKQNFKKTSPNPRFPPHSHLLRPQFCPSIPIFRLRSSPFLLFFCMAAPSPSASNNSSDTGTTATAATANVAVSSNHLANRTGTPPKTLRGLNKPKCRVCGNVARSRLNYFLSCHIYSLWLEILVSDASSNPRFVLYVHSGCYGACDYRQFFFSFCRLIFR